MSGLFDEIVQNEVNRVHNQFAQERDELPVVDSSLLMEKRADPVRDPHVFIPSVHGRSFPKPSPRSVTKSNDKTRAHMAQTSRGIEGIAKSVGQDALNKGKLASIEFKDSVMDRLHKIKNLVSKIDSNIRTLSTQATGRRYGETIDEMHGLIVELKQYSPGEMRNVANEMGNVSRELASAIAKRGGPNESTVNDLILDMKKLLTSVEKHAIRVAEEAELGKLELGEEESARVGETILKQMGGRKFFAMTGGRGVTIPDGLVLKWPTKKKSKGNVVEIKLRSDDTYDMEFFNSTIKTHKSVKKYNGIQADQLASTFTNQAGLRLTMSSDDPVLDSIVEQLTGPATSQLTEATISGMSLKIGDLVEVATPSRVYTIEIKSFYRQEPDETNFTGVVWVRDKRTGATSPGTSFASVQLYGSKYQSQVVIYGGKKRGGSTRYKVKSLKKI